MLLSSVFFGIKHATRVMEGNGGVIINTASTAGVRAGLGPHVYTAAKHGVLGLTKQAAINHLADNIRVNAVSPGPTLTEATKAGLEGVPETVQKKISALNPFGTLVDEDEIAATVLFLCSGRATMINGHDIPLDGGQLAKL